jgi:hypothetical protein
MRTLTRAESKGSDNGNQAIRAQQAAQNFFALHLIRAGTQGRAPYSDGLCHFEPFEFAQGKLRREIFLSFVRASEGRKSKKDFSFQSG